MTFAGHHASDRLAVKQSNDRSVVWPAVSIQPVPAMIGPDLRAVRPYALAQRMPLDRTDGSRRHSRRRVGKLVRRHHVPSARAPLAYSPPFGFHCATDDAFVRHARLTTRCRTRDAARLAPAESPR